MGHFSSQTLEYKESELTAPQVSTLTLAELTNQIKTESMQLISQSVWIISQMKDSLDLDARAHSPIPPPLLEAEKGSSSNLRSGTEAFPAPAAQAAALSLISQFFCSRLLPL